MLWRRQLERQTKERTKRIFFSEKKGTEDGCAAAGGNFLGWFSLRFNVDVSQRRMKKLVVAQFDAKSPSAKHVRYFS